MEMYSRFRPHGGCHRNDFGSLFGRTRRKRDGRRVWEWQNLIWDCFWEGNFDASWKRLRWPTKVSSWALEDTFIFLGHFLPCFYHFCNVLFFESYLCFRKRVSPYEKLYWITGTVLWFTSTVQSAYPWYTRSFNCLSEYKRVVHNLCYLIWQYIYTTQR